MTVRLVVGEHHATVGVRTRAPALGIAGCQGTGCAVVVVAGARPPFIACPARGPGHGKIDGSVEQQVARIHGVILLIKPIPLLISALETEAEVVELVVKAECKQVFVLLVDRLEVGEHLPETSITGTRFVFFRHGRPKRAVSACAEPEDDAAGARVGMW